MGHDNGTGSFSRHFFSAKSFSWSVYVLGIVFHLLFTLNGILLLLWIALRTTDMPLVKQYWNGTLLFLVTRLRNCIVFLCFSLC